MRKFGTKKWKTCPTSHSWQTAQLKSKPRLSGSSSSPLHCYLVSNLSLFLSVLVKVIFPKHGFGEITVPGPIRKYCYLLHQHKHLPSNQPTVWNWNLIKFCSNAYTPTHYLCDFAQVTQPLWVSVKAFEDALSLAAERIKEPKTQTAWLPRLIFLPHESFSSVRHLQLTSISALLFLPTQKSSDDSDGSCHFMQHFLVSWVQNLQSTITASCYKSSKLAF